MWKLVLSYEKIVSPIVQYFVIFSPSTRHNVISQASKMMETKSDQGILERSLDDC